ncbi:hypothetical protein MEO41_29230, partial [Dolichospermum sp. ST_sed4]|nr:hypothetical protein [Dolichospermum sp. ST_sed4]
VIWVMSVSMANLLELAIAKAKEITLLSVFPPPFFTASHPVLTAGQTTNNQCYQYPYSIPIITSWLISGAKTGEIELIKG